MTSRSKNLVTLVAILVVVIAFAHVLPPRQARVPSLSTATPLRSASLSVISPSGLTADVGQLTSVLWTATNYQPQTVSVSVIRKISDNPARYELVRTVAEATRNDGSATWVPAPKDLGQNTLIQVGCTLSAQACTAGVSSSPLAVVNDGRFVNTANLYQSIEAAQN